MSHGKLSPRTLVIFLELWMMFRPKEERERRRYYVAPPISGEKALGLE